VGAYLLTLLIATSWPVRVCLHCHTLAKEPAPTLTQMEVRVRVVSGFLERREGKRGEPNRLTTTYSPIIRFLEVLVLESFEAIVGRSWTHQAPARLAKPQQRSPRVTRGLEGEEGLSGY
jgi:hypothetical protein